MTSVLWFRRDLRLGDNPALLAARDAAGDGVLPLFVLDDALRGPSGAPRLAFLYRCLRALDDSLGGRLVVVPGKPENVLPRLFREVEASSVHVAADFGPYGRERDSRVADALPSGVPLVRTGSPYAVAPGRVRKDDDTPFRVYSPFYRAWMRHGWRAPADSAAAGVRWLTGVDTTGIPKDPDLPAGLALPDAGEAAGLARWAQFREAALRTYKDERNRPDRPATSRLSVHLKYGTVHPRTLLRDLKGHSGEGAETFRKELAWREFYADVLWQRPESARECLNPAYRGMELDTDPDRFAAWAEGRTGYPIVDAGMRQLRADAWVHNRVRMIVASFLVKDLHLDWTLGAREFMRHLVDGDLASNNHGWQWVAGCGTDAAPFYRVFNPITQGRKFDPSGDYVRTYVPELRSVAGADVHEPWELPGGVPSGYPERIVDHAAERLEALARYERVRR
ncbi:MAG TPA: deoxyribodipyrimidine photo-lyase [Mycobacteriales bacterium]|nr:deoxyribodipyrimidine photo-lyase [Mycobacteriales bacterium]